MKLPFLKKKSRTPQEFWEWFAQNCGSFVSPEMQGKDQKALGAALESVHEGLMWGIGLGKDGEPHTLEISADGISERIPHVLRVVRAAPAIPGWKVVAFRQPIEGCKLQMAGNVVDADNILVMHKPAAPGAVHLALFLPIPREAPREVFNQVGFVCLDHAIGEYRVMTQIGVVEFFPVDQAPPNAPSLSWLRSHLEEIEGELPPGKRLG